MENVQIRDYTDADYNQVKQILIEGNLFDETLDSRDNLRKKIERDPASIIVAVFDNRVIGNAYIVEDGWAHFIFRLSVSKEHRKRGVGKLLMQAAEKRMKDRGTPEVGLLVRSDDNELVGYYKKQGYTHSEKTFRFMWKKLS
ncbi:MAG: GNAT family N-acetyltransferase [Candidatus Aenigmatarchaeota archaeon]|nr:MAG: GNAT family N-acetyltransferase [Candidatus Aenigmarchaeota archaeon]